MSSRENLTRGLIAENPIFRLALGACPTLAVTTSTFNGLGMGLAVLFVLSCSNVLVSLLRKFVPQAMRIPSYITIITTFATLVQLFCEAYVPALYSSLGIFLPLIAVNCILLGRAEAFASKNGVWDSLLDAIGMGGGFTLALVIMASIREIFGAGTWFGLPVGFDSPAGILQLAPGGFLVLGVCVAVFNKVFGKGETP